MGFNGRGGFGGGMQQQNAMMKQIQKLQEEMKQAQEELEESEVVGSAGGGLVEITLSGKKEMVSISIKPDAIDPDDIEFLEDLIVAAYNAASDAIDSLSEEKLGKFGSLGGLM